MLEFGKTVGHAEILMARDIQHMQQMLFDSRALAERMNELKML
jgi:hypothetical protein